MMDMLTRLIHEEEGAAASEYAVLLALVIVTVLIALWLFDIREAYNTVTNKVKNATNNQT
ncbi:MAG: hypothetical protein JSW31_04355 [Burkholderiales bacterium]|nr:MAG: hypothetical protein JSW31_04355 [Burkholderiales bacterium]